VERGLSAKSVKNHLTILRRMLVVARKWKLIDVVPEVQWPKVPKASFDFLSFDEAEALVAAADAEWRTIILVAWQTGLRLGELRGLRWQDVDLKVGRLTVNQAVSRKVIGTPKSNKAREVPLTTRVRAALVNHQHDLGELVFCRPDGGVLPVGHLRWPLWRACDRAGIRRLGWHALRHTFASHLVMRGVPIVAVQELLGHSTVEMTMRYAHLSPNVLRTAIAVLDTPPSGPSAPPAAEPTEGDGRKAARHPEAVDDGARKGRPLTVDDLPGLEADWCNGGAEAPWSN
jgi:integrase